MGYTGLWILLLTIFYEPVLYAKEQFLLKRCFVMRNKCEFFCHAECIKRDFRRGECWRMVGTLCGKNFKRLPWLCRCTTEGFPDTVGTRVYDHPEPEITYPQYEQPDYDQPDPSQQYGQPGGYPNYGQPGGYPQYDQQGGNQQYGQPGGYPQYGQPGGNQQYGQPGGNQQYGQPGGYPQYEQQYVPQQGDIEAEYERYIQQYLQQMRQ